MSKNLVLILQRKAPSDAWMRSSDSFEFDGNYDDMPHAARGCLAELCVTFKKSVFDLRAVCIPDESDCEVVYINPALDANMDEYFRAEEDANYERAQEHRAELRMGK